ncbi:PIG-L deacetylase family protein [Rubricoccus marinus]|uniref:GlcNAc-PI de-N-acetylase n=1 Tax=Rubricoccus marinus TaxID=716817 RepID=A0A259TZM2_9BACT|nr:PIG-L deacetylase family protein [Rubricoccus marinus]OZC03047.1 hypothetical protein BSZ36_08740 [Rubricoccus marinus]
MFDLAPGLGRDEPLRLLALGAHADDIEIGAGGTVMRLLAERPRTEVTWAVLTGNELRDREAAESAQALLKDASGVTIENGRFRDGHLPASLTEVKEWAQARLGAVKPHLVLTTGLFDRHQDHRLTAELAWQTFRGATITEVEIPKWDGDTLRPNAFVRLSDVQAEAKVAHLMSHFPSQQSKGWYDADTFRATLRLRGIEAGCRWAEAFTCRKLAW